MTASPAPTMPPATPARPAATGSEPSPFIPNSGYPKPNRSAFSSSRQARTPALSTATAAPPVRASLLQIIGRRPGRPPPLCQDQVRHQGQPLLVELEG